MLFITRNLKPLFALLLISLLSPGVSKGFLGNLHLQGVLTQIPILKDRGVRPLLVFDLDETLIDSMPRMFVAFRDVLGQECASGSLSIEQCGQLKTLALYDIYHLPNRYDQRSFFLKSGAVLTEAQFVGFNKKIVDTYLSGKGMEHDRAYLGSVSFLRRVLEKGAEVIFVSSRYQERQGQGTVQSLLDLGLFRPGDLSSLYLRPDGMKSIDFKRWSYERIFQMTRDPLSQAQVLAVFENEPENFNALIEKFPAALSFFVLGAFLKEEPLSGRPILIKDFVTSGN